MSKFTLTVLITNYNTVDFIALTLFALKNLTKNEYVVLINDNGSQPKELKKLIKLAQRYDDIYVHFRDCGNESGSVAHGKALDILMKNVDTKYTAVFDSDATVLIKNWDQFLINQLEGQVKIAGTPQAKVLNNKKPDDFPFQFITLFETKIFKDLSINWQPQTNKDGFISYEKDTAWELREKYLKTGYIGKILDVKSTRIYKDGPFRNLIVCEYYINNGKNIFGSHFGRGATLGAAKYKNFLYKIPFIGRYLKKLRGLKEKKLWIKKCYEIINQQINTH